MKMAAHALLCRPEIEMWECTTALMREFARRVVQQLKRCDKELLPKVLSEGNHHVDSITISRTACHLLDVDNPVLQHSSVNRMIRYYDGPGTTVWGYTHYQCFSRMIVPWPTVAPSSQLTTQWYGPRGTLYFHETSDDDDESSGSDSDDDDNDEDHQGDDDISSDAEDGSMAMNRMRGDWSGTTGGGNQQGDEGGSKKRDAPEDGSSMQHGKKPKGAVLSLPPAKIVDTTIYHLNRAEQPCFVGNCNVPVYEGFYCRAHYWQKPSAMTEHICSSLADDPERSRTLEFSRKMKAQLCFADNCKSSVDIGFYCRKHSRANDNKGSDESSSDNWFSDVEDNEGKPRTPETPKSSEQQEGQSREASLDKAIPGPESPAEMSGRLPESSVSRQYRVSEGSVRRQHRV